MKRLTKKQEERKGTEGSFQKKTTREKKEGKGTP